MRLRLGVFAVLSLAVFLVAAAVSTFVVDPENLGVRIALYVLALIGLIGALLFAVFALVFPIFGRTGIDAAAVAEAVAAGRKGLARVVAARPTGGQLNGYWVYDVRLVVAAADVPAYTVDDRVRVHRDDGKLYGKDEIVTVVRLAADAPQVVVVNGPASTAQDGKVPKDAPGWPGQ